MADIVKVFEQFADIKSVNMLTSGFFPKKVEKTVNNIKLAADLKRFIVVLFVSFQA